MKLANILSSIAVSLVAASSLFGGAGAFHNFSPICTTGVTDMQQSIHSAGPDATMANWKISIAKGTTAGQFVVTAAGTPMTYGLVLRVQDAKTKNPTGSFIGTIPPTLKVAAVGDGTSCGPSVVTHIDNPASTSIALTWDSQKFVGAVNISAIVISSAGTQWTVIGTNVQVNADGSFVAAGAAAPPAAATLQGIMQYRVYIIAAGCALGIMAIAMIVRIAIKRQQNSSKV